ncbi:DUF4202 family protein [candidate division WWE3 bacterium]|nr:DUF4202 family protein [candidate division WWE3 bacterium]
MSEKIQKLENKLTEIMSRWGGLDHGQETREWLLKIDPQSPWQLQIAAFAHDIETAIPYIEGMTPKRFSREDCENYDEYKGRHAKRSAQVIEHIMTTYNFPKEDIKKVCNAIEKREVGGDTDSDLVRDADSIRWFDKKGHPKYIENYGIDAAKEKALWMYERATKKTRELIDSLPYDKRIKNYIAQKDAS